MTDHVSKAKAYLARAVGSAVADGEPSVGLRGNDVLEEAMADDHGPGLELPQLLCVEQPQAGRVDHAWGKEVALRGRKGEEEVEEGNTTRRGRRRKKGRRGRGRKRMIVMLMRRRK